ncbi:MAG: DUF72 domain-containing protein [Pirellulaceae bacterium]
MQKDEVVSALREMADLLEITDANTFEVRAFRNASQGLEDWDGDLQQAASDAKLNEIPSIGKGIAQVITELVETGDASELQRVRGLVPDELPILLRFRGLGPKRVRALWQELGVESPADLQQAAEEGRVAKLKGFGAKTVEKIMASIEYFQDRDRPRELQHQWSETPLPHAPKSSGRIWAGTSGYSYPAWKGSFYPGDARTDDLLEHYSGQLNTVEINNTFYRFPSQKVVTQWLAQTPDHFHFALKAHRRVTHQMRLSPASRDRIIEFVDRCGQLGSRLGCLLYQFPPDFARDDTRLDLLLATLPEGPRYAVEFRHDSWRDDAVLKRLRDRNIAWVSGDAENEPPEQCVTADFVYTRLRRTAYSSDELDGWNRWFDEQRKANRDVLAYLKHDDSGEIPKAIVQRWGPG